MDAFLSRMQLDVIGVLYCLQRVSLVPRLPARFLATWLPLALRPGLLQPIARRWLATVAAVFRRLVFQFLYPRLEKVKTLGKAVDQLSNQRNYRFLTFDVGGVYLFSGWRNYRDHEHILPGMCDFSKSRTSQEWLSSYPG